MKKIFIIILLIFIINPSTAQKKWKQYLLAGSTAFVSGMLDGTIETISYHYETGFKPKFKNVNDQYWNPALSWKNKYKNGDSRQGAKFQGSTTALVFTTDAYHMLRTSKRTLDGLTLAWAINKDCSRSLSKKAKWKNGIKDFVFLTAIRCIGFHVTYSYLFKVNKY